MEENKTNKNKGMMIAMAATLVMILANILMNFYALKLGEGISKFEPILAISTLLCALYYVALGCKKDDSIFFKTYMVMFAICLFVTVISCAVNKASMLTIPLNIVALVVACIFCFGKNLGKKTSYGIAAVLAVVTAITAIYTGVTQPGIIGDGTLANTVTILRTCSNTILGIITIIMVYAKYVDKDSRGTV